MPKKAIHYIMLSGWLPIPYSQWNTVQSCWVGSTSLNTDQFYNACKLIADRLNDKKKKGNLKRTIISYLKTDEGIKREPRFFELFFEDAFEMVQQSYEIEQYIMKNYV